MIETSLDQTMTLSEENKRAFDEVDDIIGKSITAGDPILALEYGRGLLVQAQVKGLALAKLLYRLRESWNLFERAGVDDSLEALANAHMGRSPQTITKYIRLWENVFANEEIPENIRVKLMGRPIKDLLLITALAREGTSNDTMKKIADAPDTDAVRDIVKSERGEQTSSKASIRLSVETRDNVRNPRGVIIARRGNQTEICGSLDLDSDSDMVQKAIARIINNSGMVELR